MTAMTTTQALEPRELGLIPSPQKLTLKQGMFKFDPAQSILANPALKVEVRPDSGQLGDEGYRLAVTHESIRIEAATPAGAFYAKQTLLQLASAVDGQPTAIPCLEIEDQPRFAWRGMHLDVGRHYMPVEFIKEFIDLLAMHKLNTFHWHLTEDQGWRIEINKYPRLTTVGATRAESPQYGKRNRGDGAQYGPYFYTRGEIREIVAYAADRHITVVPEIELPGHSVAALAAYPKLGCTGGPYTVRTRWGVEDDVYCAGNDEVFNFLENVLTEVLALFPSQFIHIGGDECPKRRWQACPKCQARIREQGLKNEHELQSYFIQRVEKFLNSRGRRLIGWDEILEGGLAPNAAVMSWRGMGGGLTAARAGHDVVMSPTSHCYFDYAQARGPGEPESIGGYLPLEQVYAFEPVPADVNAEAASHILGIQGNLWTEYMWTPEDVEYKAFPRACALAEVAWLDPAARNWQDFHSRLGIHLHRLDTLNVDYRPLDTPPLTEPDRDIANLKAVEQGDDMEAIIAKAARVVPTPRQFDYMKTEYIGFIHWGPNAFSRREWGTGKEDAALFNPATADTDRWCRTMRAAGMRMVVITAKHHDGYCLWQTRYTDHSVAGSPWKEGRGDVVGELAESCRKYGLKMGVYLSPADLYQIESPTGLYGNGSTYTERTIPRPVEGRPFEDQRTFRFEVDDYNEYFLNQLFELLTEYGPIHEVWFDGAHPKRKGNQQYTYDHWYKLIRELAPAAVIFGKGPDVRWCGNEAGNTRLSEWSVIPLPTHPDRCEWPDLRGEDLGSRDKLKSAKYLYWLPAEVDTSIRAGWFYRDENQRVRPESEVFDIYERSVGGNATLILNVPPNREGRFADRDVASLLASGERIRRTYGDNLAEDAHCAARAVLDGDPRTYWQPCGPEDALIIRLPQRRPVNRFVFQEEVTGHGQRIEKHALDAWVDNEWRQVAKGTTVGHKRILRFETIATQRLRLRIIESRLMPAIASVSVHCADPAPILPDEIILTVPREGWKIHSVSSEHGGYDGAKAFDGNPETFWHTYWGKPPPAHPHHLAIDMGRMFAIVGFTYLPRQDRRIPDSMIEDWRFEVSDDGEIWVEVAQGTFGNIFNDPTRRVERFKPVTCRYVRLVSLSGADGKPYAGAAEIEVLME